MPEPAKNTIRIRLFAGLRESAGWGERDWPIEATAHPNLTPNLIWHTLALPGRLSEIRIAINQQFAAADTPLLPGDELAFLPPISGG